MAKSRKLALLRGFAHVVPASACIVLITLNCSSYYIGEYLTGFFWQNEQKMAGLQFVAKIHEVLILVSLGLVIEARVQRELLLGDGLPFGALFLPSGFQQIGFLWSPAFSGICFHDWQSRGRKYLSIAMIVLCVLLALSVGPSSATLMRPRLDEWPGGGTGFWMAAPVDQLLPPVIAPSAVLPVNSSDCHVDSKEDTPCASGNWRSLEELFFSFWPQLTNRGTMPKEVHVKSRGLQRVMRVDMCVHLGRRQHPCRLVEKAIDARA